MGFIIFIHVLVCILLMIAILMQSGRGGGLTEQFAGAESMFGARTNVFMVRITAVLASIFLVTSITLAHLSAKKNRSIIPDTITKSKPVSKTTASSLPAAPTTPTSPLPVSANAVQ